MSFSENKFLDFYRERFGSGANVASYFQNEIAADAAAIGVIWDRVCDKATWQNGKTGKFNVSGKNLLKGFGSVGVYASIETDNNGVEFPLITFKNKGGKGDTVVFNGLSYIWELFKDEKDAKVPQAKIAEWERKKRERDEENAKRLKIAQQRHAEESQRKAANVAKELQHFNQLPRAASFVYTDAKFIPSVLNHLDARTGSDKHGNYLALQLHNIDLKPVGIQRIYDRKITKADGSKTNKDFTWGMDKDAAHLIIGDINTAERIYTTEGFATGGSIFLAMEQLNIASAVIVALDAGNMIKTVNEYLAKKPYLPLMLGIDNDMWKQRQGKGNAGFLVAMELLAKHDELKAFAPNFDNVDSVYQPTDWNDLHVRAGLNEVVKQLKGNKAKVRCDGNLFEKALRRLNYVNFRDVMTEAMKCLQVGMKVGMPKYAPSDVVSTITTSAQLAGIPKDRLNRKVLAKKANQIFHAKVKEAQQFRSFSDRITDPAQCPDHIVYHKFNKSVVDQEVQDHINSLEGIIITRLPMGSGKTQGIIKPVMWQDERTFLSSHRMTLVGASVEALNKKPDENSPETPATQMLREKMLSAGVVNYQEPNIKIMMPFVNKLASCINSILKPEFTPLLNNLDNSCFDEASQTLRHVAAGSAIKYPVAVFNRWLEIMATTRKQVILADADANDLLVEFCEMALTKRNAHFQILMGENIAPQKIHIIDGHTDCSDTNIFYTDSNTAFNKVIEDVGAGNKVLVANDSANDGDKLFTHLQNVYPEKTGLFIEAETKDDKAVEQFNDSPNAESLKYDYVIYSPSISSGVSIENGHFNKHYGIFCGTVAPSDAIQMIRRDRKAREFVLGLSTIHSNREESSMAMWIGMMMANDNKLNVELNRETGKIELNTENLDFDRFRLDLIAQENKAKNDFANNLLCILFADRYKIKSLDASEIDAEKGKAAKEAASELLKAIDMNRHLDQPTPNDDARDELLNKANLSRDEKAQLNRWDIENALMMPVNEDSIDFHHKGGMAKTKLFELLNMSPEKAREFDENEVTAKIQPSHRLYLVKQRQALREFFEMAGWNWETGEGCATEERLTAALEHLISGDRIHLFNNWFKFGGYVNPFSRAINPVNKAKSILEAMGLNMATVRLGRHNSESLKRQRYYINPESFQFMSLINKRRNETQASAYKQNNLDSDLIHSSPVIYIDNELNVDHSQATNTNGYSWIELLKQTIKNLSIPKEYTPKIMNALQAEGFLVSEPPKQGIQPLIKAVYSYLSDLNPLNT